MKTFGFYLSLFPLALLGSVGSTIISLVLFFISLMVSRRVSYLDWALLVISFMFALGYIRSGPYEQQFVISQASSYFAVIFSLRFFYVCRQDLVAFVQGLSPRVYVALCAIYLAIQTQIGYVYEVGVLEGFLLVRICTCRDGRALLLTILAAYLLAMYVVSTRTTPLIVAMIVASIFFVKPSRSLLKAVYLAAICMMPIYGFAVLYLDLEVDVSGVDDNAAIRLEMVKSATSMVGVKEFIFGTGLGEPFRSVSYDYAFSHPLLVESDSVMQTSNHNSMFDLFLRFGIFGYVLFAVFFLRVLRLNSIASHRPYALLFVCLYLLSVNAYIDSTRLSPSCAIFLAGILIVSRRGFAYERCHSCLPLASS